MTKVSPWFCRFQWFQSKPNHQPLKSIIQSQCQRKSVDVFLSPKVCSNNPAAKKFDPDLAYLWLKGVPLLPSTYLKTSLNKGTSKVESTKSSLKDIFKTNKPNQPGAFLSLYISTCLTGQLIFLSSNVCNRTIEFATVSNTAVRRCFRHGLSTQLQYFCTYRNIHMYIYIYVSTSLCDCYHCWSVVVNNGIC